MGFTISLETVEEIFVEADVDNSGQIDLKEFEDALRIVHERYGFTTAEVKELEALFDRYDTDNSGEICADELASALGWFGTPTSIEQARTIIKRFDDDGN